MSDYQARLRDAFKHLKERQQKTAAAAKKCDPAPAKHVDADYTLSKAYPTNENSLTIFNGDWVTSIPGQEATTGGTPLCADGRLQWLLKHKPVRGLSVLELGPLEGAHTYMLEKIGGATVTAIEANSKSFLKTLVLKNYFNLKAKILYGDFVKYLSEPLKEHYDMCVAVGVLYHMSDPINFLTNIGKNFKRLFMWTHYFDAKRIQPSEIFDETRYSTTLGKREIFYHKHHYFIKRPEFLGGIDPYSYWMERESLLGYLLDLGFRNIDIVYENTHPNFPDICFYAEK